MERVQPETCLLDFLNQSTKELLINWPINAWSLPLSNKIDPTQPVRSKFYIIHEVQGFFTQN